MSSLSNINSYGANIFASPVRSVRRISSDDLPFLAPRRDNDDKSNSQNVQYSAKALESTDATGIVISDETKAFLNKLQQNMQSSDAKSNNANYANNPNYSSEIEESQIHSTYTRSGNYAHSSGPSLSSTQTMKPAITKTIIAYSGGSVSVGASSASLNSSSAVLSASFTTNPTSIPPMPQATSPDVDVEAGARVRQEEEKYPKIPNSEGKAEAVVTGELTPEEEAYVEALKKRDAEVRTHEQSHVSSGGGLTSGISYEYVTGPDGQRYAMGGSVQIDTTPVKGDPDASIEKARKIRSAALAPASPSSQDRSVAAAASAMESEARREKMAIAEEEKQAEMMANEEEKKVKEEEQLEEDREAQAKEQEQKAQESQSQSNQNTQNVVSVSDMNEVIADETIDVSELMESMSVEKDDNAEENAKPFFEAQASSVGDIANSMSSVSVPAV